jgi:hypothetical protein
LVYIFSLAPLADTCPAGYYCPEQTADPVGCPEGSYSHTPGLQMESQCVNCTGGYYCNETGQLSYIEAEHWGGKRGGGEIKYPEGSYSHTPGLQMESQCINCTGGYYCNETG